MFLKTLKKSQVPSVLAVDKDPCRVCTVGAVYTHLKLNVSGIKC